MDLGAVYALVDPPENDPITVAEVKDYLKITHTADDAVLQSWVKAAVKRFQDITGRQLITATVDLQLDRWPCGREPLPIDKVPLQAVVSITYYDTSDVAHTLSDDDYRVDTISTPARILLRAGKTWPTSCRSEQAAVIRLVVGADDVDEDVKVTLARLVGAYTQQRTTQDPPGLMELLAPYTPVRLA